jgi:hypothetical protein
LAAGRPLITFQLLLSPDQPPVTYIIETPMQCQQAISTITQAMKVLSKEERRIPVDPLSQWRL